MHPGKHDESNDPEADQEYEEKGSWHQPPQKALVRADPRDQDSEKR